MVRIILTVDNDGKIRGLMVKCMVNGYIYGQVYS